MNDHLSTDSVRHFRVFNFPSSPQYTYFHLATYTRLFLPSWSQHKLLHTQIRPSTFPSQFHLACHLSRSPCRMTLSRHECISQSHLPYPATTHRSRGLHLHGKMCQVPQLRYSSSNQRTWLRPAIAITRNHASGFYQQLLTLLLISSLFAVRKLSSRVHALILGIGSRLQRSILLYIPSLLQAIAILPWL